jgi:phenylpyruvate tautomerase PptA (4-oxalocrotonate tautomerase family)
VIPTRRDVIRFGALLAMSLGAVRTNALARGGDAMPLMKFDVIEGHSDAELKALLDAAHRAMVAAFKVPERDRYQILRQHPRAHMIIEDTGLGIERSDKIVVVQVVSRRRSQEKKEALYRLLSEELEKSCGIKPSDVMVSIVENGDEDWAFGIGRAQFLTGEL